MGTKVSIGRSTRDGLTSLLAFGLACALASCGQLNGSKRGGSAEEALAPETPVGLPAGLARLKPLARGYSWYVSPFGALGKANVFLRARGTGVSAAGPSATIPGYHWPWDFPGVTTSAKPADPKIPPGEEGFYAFNVPFSGPWRGRWPAVTGLQGDAAGHLSAAGFAVLKPSDLALPHRVYFVDEKAAPIAFLRHQAKTCGTGCVDFASYAALLDGPVSFAKAAPFEAKQGNVTIVFGVTSAAGRAKANDLLVRTGNPRFASDLFDDLSLRWGRTSASYVFHLGLQNGCSYQGLEHASSSALALGVGCDESVVRRMLLLMTHEMIHAWNAKAVFPREHARLSVKEFLPERTRQLYFYEGFTEGLARLVVARSASARVPLAERVAQWNETLTELGKLAQSKETPEALSLASAPNGYTLGAWLALRAGVEARKVEAAAGKDQATAASAAFDRVMNVMALLARGGAPGGPLARDGAKPFLLSSPMFARFAFGAFDGVLKDAANSNGYDRTALRAAFEEALGLDPEAPFLGEFFATDAHAPTAAELNACVQEAAAVSGLSTEGTGALRFVVPAAVPEAPFPF